MQEVFIITWQKTRLELRRLPSVGEWSEELGFLGAVELARPTRLARFEHNESGGRLTEALTQLLSDVDVVLPVWFLAPLEWTLRVKLPLMEIKDQSLLRNQINWEIRERLYGELSHYRIIVLNQPNGANVIVIAVRNYILDYVSSSANEIGLELAGIGLEPLPGEAYDFEHPFDLRDATPLEEDIKVPQPVKKTVSPAIGVAALAAVIVGIGGIYLFFGSSTDKVASPPPVAAPRKIPAALKKKSTPVAVDTAKALPSADSVQSSSELVKVTTAPPSIASKPSVTEVPTSSSEAPSATFKTSLSPFSALMKSLPPQTHLELATVSPIELMVEISNLNGLESWMNGLKSTPGLQSGKVVGKFTKGKIETMVVRFNHPGLSESNHKRDIEGWQRKAQACGLKVQNRRAWGGLNQALQLTDELWKDMHGFSKFYLTPEKNQWLVVIQ